MSFLRYAKEHAIEALLFMTMTGALAMTLDECFFIDNTTPQNIVLTIATIIVLSIALYASAYNRLSVIIGIPLIIVGLVIANVIFSQITPTQLFEDSYANPAFAFHVAWTTTLLLFLCSRRTPLLTAGYVIGAFVCSAVQFLYKGDHIIEAVVFLVSGAVLVMMSRQTGNRGKADVGPIASKASGLSRSAGIAISGIAVTGVALLAALGVFFAIIAPLNPPASELKIITEHYALEEVHVSGLVDISHMVNQDKDSKNTEDDDQKSNQQDASGNDADEKGAPNQDGDENLTGAGMQGLGDALMYAIKYFEQNWAFILIAVLLAIALLLALVISVRRIMRKRSLDKLKGQGPRKEAMGIYKYLSNGMTLCGVCNRGANTPTEMATKARPITDQFERGEMPMRFEELTETFARIAYGSYTPDEDESTRMREYARAFPKHALRYVGRRKYLRLFFKI